VGIAIGFESYRIGEGGPLRRFELRCRLTTPVQQIFAFLVVAWVPILVLGAWFQATTGWREPLLHDLATHVRLLVAAPLFLLLDHRFPSLCSGMLSLLARQSFVDEADRPRFERTLARARRHSDSWIPEAVLACLSLAMGVAALEDIVHVRALADRSGLPALRAWYAFVTLPLFQFLLWRSLWRWAIWASILFDLSRLRLNLVATHPDRRGGIAFLRLPSLRYCAVLLFAIASVACVEWSGRFEIGTSLDSFRPLLLLFSVVATLVAVGPTLLFAVQLYRVRHDGAVEIAELATRCGRSFDRRWVASDRDDLGRDEEIQGLTALGQTYRETVDQIRLSLFRKRDIYLLLAATTLPVLLVMLARVPADDWQRFVGTMLFGGLTP
jgi:hypothetical protein